MGGSIPLAIGGYLAGHRNPWAVTGDFSFIAAGHLGLVEASQRGIPLRIIILNNGMAETTGGQLIPEGALEPLLSGYKKYTRYIDNPRDDEMIKTTLIEARDSDEMRIIIANYKQK